MDIQSFTTSQVAKILGKSTRFVIDWTERGLFIADIQSASGSGIKRLFSYNAVLLAALVLALREKFELPRSAIRSVAFPWPEEFLQDFPKIMQGTFIYCKVPEGGGYFTVFSSKKLIDLAKEGGFPTQSNIEAMTCVDLAPIKATIDKKIAEIN